MTLFDVYSLYDICHTRAQGAYVWDDKNNRYLDMYGGHAVISIGHSHPYYVEKITEQLKQIGFYSNSVKIPTQEKLADKLGKLSGYEDYQLFLCNSGAEANENALKLASFHNNRKKIIAFEGAFHGRTSLAVSVTDNPSISAPVNASENVVFLPLNDIESFEKAINNEISAVIIEGIQGVAGIRIPDAQFLQKIRSLCNENGVLLIVDEIQSGYGRTGLFFAHQHSGIKADIITIAKGMGNGFPVAGVLISPKIKAKIGMLGTTFGGNHLACAAANAVLDVITSENLIENAKDIGNYLVEKLKGVDKIKEIRAVGLMIGIEFYHPVEELRKKLLFQHKILTGNSSNKCTLRILPALNIKREDIDYLVESLFQEINVGQL